MGSCSGHSFWISDATTAVSWGLQVHLIKTLSHCFSGACQRCVHKSTASLGGVSSVFTGLILLELGVSGVASWGLWLMCHKSPSPQSGLTPLAPLGRAGRAHS